MQWICDISLFLVISGILLELIADTRYFKFAKWVAGVILLLLFLKPFTEQEKNKEWFASKVFALDYAIGSDRVLDEIYEVDEQTETSVLKTYKETVAMQIGRLLEKNGLVLLSSEFAVAEDGSLQEIAVLASYADREQEGLYGIPTVTPVRIGDTPVKKTVSPMELYIREVLSEFYQLEESKIEVVIQEV